MDWNYNFGWTILGLIILIAGGAVVAYHRQIADNLASGVSSYGRIKQVGVIAIVLGIIVMLNLHTAILTAFVNLVFKRG